MLFRSREKRDEKRQYDKDVLEDKRRYDTVVLEDKREYDKKRGAENKAQGLMIQNMQHRGAVLYNPNDPAHDSMDYEQVKVGDKTFAMPTEEFKRFQQEQAQLNEQESLEQRQANQQRTKLESDVSGLTAGAEEAKKQLDTVGDELGRANNDLRNANRALAKAGTNAAETPRLERELKQAQKAVTELRKQKSDYGAKLRDIKIQQAGTSAKGKLFVKHDQDRYIKNAQRHSVRAKKIIDRLNNTKNLSEKAKAKLNGRIDTALGKYQFKPRGANLEGFKDIKPNQVVKFKGGYKAYIGPPPTSYKDVLNRKNWREL